MKTWRPFPVLFCILSCFFMCLSHALDTLRHGEYLYSNKTLISAGGVFELGFFSSPSAPNGYLGIWFKNDKTQKPVWVANRDSPLLDSSGVLTIRYDGNMIISDRRGIPFIVNYGNLSTNNNTSATILDSGNLILMEGEEMLWQSFDYPTDTVLAGMKLGLFNINTEQLRKQFLVSWLSTSVPASGSYALGIDPVNNTQFNVWRSDGAYQQIGFWDGHVFKFFFQSTSASLNFSFAWNSQEIYLTFSNKDINVTSWFVLASNGEIDEFRMVGQEIDIVDYSLCNDTLARSSNSCLVVTPPVCSSGNNFSSIRGSLPSSMVLSWPIRTGPYQCEVMCRNNCSCVAYTYASSEDGATVCQLYYGSNSDLLRLVGGENSYSTIYVRGNASTSDRQLLVATVMMIFLVFFILILLWYCLRRKYNSLGICGFRNGMRDSMRLLLVQLRSDENASSPNVIELGRKKDHESELPSLSFSFVVASTNNFSLANKLGQGGYGPVYKGKLLEHDIAVKRLSKNSGQGPVEFKNEVQLISKVQHRNLVKLLGCCIHREEKILIYEYMPNGSLDSFIFDRIKRRLLNWKQRMHIIEGIAQGLLYLHKYSRLRIIHRDMKISNILLDAYMNPKISDFGLAKILSGNECRAKTNRVVGTYGYMSPEYVMHGLFSTKSDVFSFGVIVLEIVSGRKNANFHESDNSLNLLGHAWNMWQSGRCSELMDSTLADSSSMDSLVLCIQVGLLCVQDCAEDRPTMSDVVSMFSNEGATLPTPKQPTYSNLMTEIGNLLRREAPSNNLVTISEIEAR